MDVGGAWFKKIRKFFWTTLALIIVSMLAFGCSGTRDESFVQPLRDAVVKHIAAENPAPIVLEDFTKFEWDQLEVVGAEFLDFSKVSSNGFPWLRFPFEATPQDGYSLWVFKKNGRVTRFATVTFPALDFDPARTTHYRPDLPRLPSNFGSLSKDEAIFKFISLTASLRPDWSYDLLFPLASNHRRDSWRGVNQECIERTSVYDTCWEIATEQHPRNSSEDWPR